MDTPSTRPLQSPSPLPSLTLPGRDGRLVHLRPLAPSDGPALDRALQGLSSESRYLRFHGARDHLSSAELRYLTEIDGAAHVAWVAAEVEAAGEELGLGVGRYVRLEGEPGVAEPAFTVVDEAQGRGVGTLLLGVLACIAARSGVERFEATVLARNTRMLEIFDQLGGSAVPAEPGVLRVTLPLRRPEAEGWPATPAGDVCRTVAEALGTTLSAAGG